MAKKEIRITVRLNEEANQCLNKAKERGYSISQYVNEILVKPVVDCIDLNSEREIMVHICKMQSELEFEQDPSIKENMREELNQICRALRSSRSHM